MSMRRMTSAFRNQRGAAAIEFALVFPLFFVLFYAIVSYGLVMTLQQSLSEASKEGARAAIKVDRTIAGWETTARSEARQAAAQVLAWLPAAQKTAIVGTDNSNINVEFPTADTIRITLTYTYNSAPLLPVLTFPVIGKIPNLPASLIVTADGLL
ncbi:MAG: uncharacterized protein H6R26_278 [Proteobacteria bacterium]|nr:uncharacterized protein [Pseudomonadota bacterium]